MRTSHDVIIIGYGLAGSVLCEQLLDRSMRVRLFDVQRDGGASRVAAGIVNPVVLRRLMPSWRAAEMLDHAEAYYPSSILHPAPLARIFATAKEEFQWAKAEASVEASPFLSRDARTDVDDAPIDRGAGYGTIKRCAWLDVNAWLDAQRARLVADDVLREARINEGDIHEQVAHVEVQGDTAQFGILCTGPFADRLPGLVPVRGELLTVRIPELKLRTMVHRGVFVLPLGDDLYRVGSTFAWNDPFSGPTDEARTFLLGQLKKLCAPLLGRGVGGEVEVVDHRSGVRPTSRDRRPIIGTRHDHPRIAVLNGLGARGVLLAPWCAKHLIDHLFDGTLLDPEVDAQRFA